MQINLSRADARMVASMVAGKAVEIHKKGAMWRTSKGDKHTYKSCIEVGKVADKILRQTNTGEKFAFPWEQKKKVLSNK